MELVQMDERELVREARHARSLHAAPARLTAETMPRARGSFGRGRNSQRRREKGATVAGPLTRGLSAPPLHHHTEAEAPHRTHITMAVDGWTHFCFRGLWEDEMFARQQPSKVSCCK